MKSVDDHKEAINKITQDSIGVIRTAEVHGQYIDKYIANAEKQIALHEQEINKINRLNLHLTK